MYVFFNSRSTSWYVCFHFSLPAWRRRLKPWTASRCRQFSPTFYEQLFHLKVFCAAFMCLQFGFIVFFAEKKSEQKLLLKCWWNWLKVMDGICTYGRIPLFRAYQDLTVVKSQDSSVVGFYNHQMNSETGPWEHCRLSNRYNKVTIIGL